MQLTNILMAALAASAATVSAAPSARGSYSVPSPDKIKSFALWAWGPHEKPEEGDLVMLDGDLESEDTIRGLVSDKLYTSCYLSAGTLEDWRADASKFSEDEQAKAYKGFDGEEVWLDIHNWESLKPEMEARLKTYASKGCMGVEFDNVDCYNNACVSGVSVEQLLKDEVEYVSWLIDTTHSLGMAAALKNAQEVGKQLYSKVDYAVNEQCLQYSECDLYEKAVKDNKLVINVEYQGGSSACDKAKSLGLLSKVQNGDSWIDCF